MALEDLDLEFEDEDDAKTTKKVDAIHTDVEIQFQGPQAVEKASSRPSTRLTSKEDGAEIKRLKEATNAVIKRLDEARPQAGQRPAASATIHRVSGSSALREDFQSLGSQEVVQLREQIRKVEFDAEVKVAVAEFKAEFLAEMLSDIKLMDHQIGQLLARINAKHPDLKQEALMIKKILADFTAKKRK